MNPISKHILNKYQNAFCIILEDPEFLLVYDKELNELGRIYFKNDEFLNNLMSIIPEESFIFMNVQDAEKEVKKNISKNPHYREFKDFLDEKKEYDISGEGGNVFCILGDFNNSKNKVCIRELKKKFSIDTLNGWSYDEVLDYLSNWYIFSE